MLIPELEEVFPIASPTFYGLKIDSTSQGVLIGQILSLAVISGVIKYGSPEVRLEDGVPNWTIKVNDPNGNDFHAGNGDYIVLTYNGDTLTGLKLYNGPTGGRYPVNASYSDFFPIEGGAPPPPPPPPWEGSV